MLDDKDTFTTLEMQKADMELAGMRGFVLDILSGACWFKGVEIGKHNFVKFKMIEYAPDLDKALNLLVWSA